MAENIDEKTDEFALKGTAPMNSALIQTRSPLNVVAPAQALGGLQTIGSTTGTPGGPPYNPGLLTPEPIPPAYTDQQLIDAITISNDAVSRVIMRMPNFNPDAFIRGKGYKILDEMKAYAAYNSALRQKKMAVLAKEMQVLPRVNGQVVKDDHLRYDRANEIADFCRYAMDHIQSPVNNAIQDKREVCWYWLDAMHSGNSTLEVIWRMETKGEYSGKRLFARFVPRVPQQITYNLDPLTNEVVSINNYTSLGWQSYLPLFRKFFTYTYQGEAGLPWGRGDARACYKHVFALNELTRMWGVALQKHGSGFMRATVDNPQEDYIQKVVTNLEAAQNVAVIVDVPGVTTDILNLPAGTLDGFIHPIQYNEKMIVKEILGNELTTGTGQGSSSYSLGTVHQATEEYFRGHPRRDLEEAIRNQLFYWLVYTNFGEEDLDCIPACSMGIWNWEENLLIAQFVEKFTGLGFLSPDYDQDMSYVRKLVGLPELPTTAEISGDHPAILPDKERVMIQMPNGDQYKAQKIMPDTKSNSNSMQ